VGDVVISARGSFKVAAVRLDHEGTFAGPNLIVVRPGRRLAAPLLLAFLRHPLQQSALVKLSVGTTVPSINTGAVASLRIIVPSHDRQEHLAKLIDLADEHYAAARHAAEIRHRLAQEIVIGKLTE
jgi:restriction endonuclease S subunit